MERMMTSWNGIRAAVEISQDPVAALMVDMLDYMMDEYAQNEMRWMELDVRNDMTRDIVRYRKRLGEEMEKKDA